MNIPQNILSMNTPQMAGYRPSSAPPMNIYSPLGQAMRQQTIPTMGRSSGIQAGGVQMGQQNPMATGQMSPYSIYPEGYQPTGIRKLDNMLASGMYTPEAENMFRTVGIDNAINQAKIAKDRGGTGGFWNTLFGRVLPMAAGFAFPGAGLAGGLHAGVTGNPLSAAGAIIPGRSLLASR